MNQPRLIFKNTVVLTISDLVDKMGGIVVTLIIARLLHASGLGIYTTAMTYYSLIALASAMGATSFLVREIAKDLTKTSRYLIHIAILGVGTSVIIMTLLLVVLPWLPYSPDLATSLYVIILAVIPGTLVTIQEAVFIAHQRTEFVTVTKLVSTLVNIGLSVWVLTHGFGVVGLMIVFVLEQYLIMFCYFYCINQFITDLHWEIDFTYFPILITEIRIFALLSLLAGIFARPEVILLSLLKDDAEVGYYSAALKIVSLWYFLPQIFMTNVFPVLSRSYYLAEAKFKLIQDKSVKYLLIIALPLTVGMIVIAEPLVLLFNGPGFERSVTVLRMLAWSLPLNTLIAVLWRVLAARNQQKLDLQTRVISLVVRVGASYPLIIGLAATGAALSTSISLLFNAILLLHYVNQSDFKMNIWWLGWRTALATAIMGCITWSLRQYWEWWALIPVASVIYLLSLYWLKIFTQDDWALFNQVWRPGFVKQRTN